MERMHKLLKNVRQENDLKTQDLDLSTSKPPIGVVGDHPLTQLLPSHESSLYEAKQTRHKRAAKQLATNAKQLVQCRAGQRISGL